MNIAVIIVTYNPDIMTLSKLVLEVNSAGSNIIIVDNSDKNIFKDIEIMSNVCSIIELGSNQGIGYAQNVGIKEARKINSDAVLFLDQDSNILARDIVKLSCGLDLKTPQIVAPLCKDIDTHEYYPSFRVNCFGSPKKVLIFDSDRLVRVDLVISSGMFITMPVFEIVGLMNEDLFIDYVDFEWCFRCKYNHVPVYVNSNVAILHKIGISYSSKYNFKNSRHSPERTYYKIRNTFLLARCNYVPKLYSLNRLLSSLINVFRDIVDTQNRKQYCRYALLGILDGAVAIKGKINDRKSNQ